MLTMFQPVAGVMPRSFSLTEGQRQFTK